eukprot:GHVR01140341.1.p1 GENE.GHVR01140341.1~~GHVR01140341.1.p1  ORF type:complete len:502 (+),score=39.79 GHVR01140341.1:141-1646(+)
MQTRANDSDEERLVQSEKAKAEEAEKEGRNEDAIKHWKHFACLQYQKSQAQVQVLQAQVEELLAKRSSPVDLADPRNFEKYSTLVPSDFAKPKEWPLSQQKEPILCCRPVGFEGLHVTLMCHIFENIVYILSHGVPSPLDHFVAANLRTKLGDSFVSEAARQDFVTDTLNENGMIPVGATFSSRDSGSRQSSDRSVSFGRRLLANVEIKNEPGSSGDVLMQNCAYYTRLWRNSFDREGHCCPSLLVDLFGPYIGIRGAVWTSRPCISSLSDIVGFLDVRQDPTLSLRQARVMMALRVGLSQLKEFYESISEPFLAEKQLMFPYTRSYVDEGGHNIMFSYSGFLEEENTRQNPIFKAEEDLSHRPVVVKFCRAYGVEVHRHVASEGFAPQLYACQQIGSWYMVVMEWIDEKDLSKGVPLEITQLQQIQSCLVNGGFVHGDLRLPNFLVNKHGKIMLCDFDWAGKEGETRYPVVLNRGIDWPEGAEIGAIILFEHDKKMLSRL